MKLIDRSRYFRPTEVEGVRDASKAKNKLGWERKLP